MTKLYTFLVLLILSSCLLSAQQFETLDQLLDDSFSSEAPGGAILIKKGDKVLFQKAFGKADMKTGEAIKENTVFNTGSISKTFVAYGILILEAEGKLSIEDYIVDHFPDFKNKALVSDIKIKHLLSHTSGMPDVRKVGSNQEFFLSAKDKENFEPMKSITALNFEPGAQFEYSNPAFNGLALIIEQVAGEPWQDFIRRRVFEPAGMSHSTITNGPHPQAGVAHAYVLEGGAFEENDYGEFPTFAAAGNGGVWCSIVDLAKYEAAIKKGVFLDHKDLEKSRKVYRPGNWTSTTPPQLGFSWFIRKADDNPHDIDLVYHTGSQGGFRSFHYSIPERDIVYIALFNRPVSNMDEILQEGLDILKNNGWMEE